LSQLQVMNMGSTIGEKMQFCLIGVPPYMASPREIPKSLFIRSIACVVLLGLGTIAMPQLAGIAYQNLGYVHLAKGVFLQDSSSLEASEGWFLQAFKISKERHTADIGLARGYIALEKYLDAISSIEIKGDDRDAFRHILLAQSYSEMGMKAESISQWEQLPAEAAYYFNALGRSYETQQDYHQAAYYYEVSTYINSSEPKLSYDLAFIYWRRLPDPQKASEAIREALQYDTGESAQRDFYQGLLCYYEQDPDCALDSWKAAIKFEPDRFVYFSYEMINVTVYNLEYFDSQNLKILARGLELFPNENGLHFWMARISIKQRDYEQAARFYKSGLSLRPDYSQMRFELGQVYYWQGQFGSAVHEFERVVTEVSDEPLYQLWLGKAYEADGSIAAAIQSYQQVIEWGGSYSHEATNYLNSLTKP